MFNKKAFFIALGVPNPDAPEALKAYTEAAPNVLGGKVITRFKLTDKLAGEKTGMSMAIVEHKSEEAIREAFASEAYAALIPLRDEAFLELDVFLAEQP